MINNEDSDNHILRILGQRIARHRLNQNKTQAALAKEGGISAITLHRIERGESVQLATMIRVLRALKMLENLNTFLPSAPFSPVQLAKMQGKQRKRASSPKNKKSTDDRWQWGDDT